MQLSKSGILIIKLFSICSFTFSSFAQVKDSIISIKPDSLIIKEELVKRYGDTQTLLSVDEMPEPVGGMQNLVNKLHYTDEAILNNIEGKVLIQFVVKTDSCVEDIKILKGLGHGLDEIGIEAIKTTKFKPGMVKGKPVNAITTVPLVFKLR